MLVSSELMLGSLNLHVPFATNSRLISGYLNSRPSPKQLCSCHSSLKKEENSAFMCKAGHSNLDVFYRSSGRLCFTQHFAGMRGDPEKLETTPVLACRETSTVSSLLRSRGTWCHDRRVGLQLSCASNAGFDGKMDTFSKDDTATSFSTKDLKVSKSLQDPHRILGHVLLGGLSFPFRVRQ